MYCCPTTQMKQRLPETCPPLLVQVCELIQLLGQAFPTKLNPEVAAEVKDDPEKTELVELMASKPTNTYAPGAAAAGLNGAYLIGELAAKMM